MGSSEKFWDKNAKRYSKRPIANEAAYQKKLHITQEYLRPDMSVLELGCGTGSTAIVHAPFVKHIRAVDISPRMLEIARANAEAQRIRNITFDCTTIDKLEVPDQSVDAVLALSVLHLLADWQAVIGRVHRMLKAGGVFVTSTACIGDSMKFFKLAAPVGQFFGVMPLVKVFTTRELTIGFSDAGFKIERQWQPGRNKAVFIVARKEERERINR